MCPSEFRPQPSDAAPRSVSPEEVSGSGQVTDRALLEKVLNSTLALCSSDEPLDEASRSALDRLVARHRGEPFSLEPVAVELVAVALRTQFATGSNSSKLWRELPVQVARTLCEDPPSRARLEAFWRRLTGG